MGSIAEDTAYHRSELGVFGTVRGRLGFSPAQPIIGANWLLYATGGLAVGHVEHSVTEVLAPGTTCLVVSGTTCSSISNDKTKVGWTVGAGIEVAFAQNWSFGAEYLYVDLGSTTLTLTPIADGGFFTNTSTSEFENRSHVAREAELSVRGAAALNSRGRAPMSPRHARPGAFAMELSGSASLLHRQSRRSLPRRSGNPPRSTFLQRRAAPRRVPVPAARLVS